MTISIELYNAAGDPAPTLTFSTQAGGGATAGQQLDVHNNRGGAGADTAFNTGLLGFELTGGVLVDSGTFAMDRGIVQVRIVQGINKTVPAGDFVPLGAGRVMALPDLGNDEGVQLEVVVDAPIDAGDLVVVVVFRAVASRSFPTTPYLTDGAGQGVITHLGRGGSAGNDLLVISGDVVENPGGVDDNVQLPDLAWDHAGRRYAQLTKLLELDDTDGSAATLGAGEEYIATISLGAGSETVTKSDKGTGLGEADRPAAPAGEEVIAYVLRQFDGLIGDDDITNVWVLGRFGQAVEDLTISLGRGEALVGSNFIRRTGTEPLTVPDDDDHEIWLLADGSHVRVAAGATQPAQRALKLYDATTASGVFTAVSDRREYLGPRQVDVLLEIHPAGSELAASDASPWVALPSMRPGSLRVPESVALSLDGAGTGTGATIVEVEYRQAGGAATSLFTSSGSDDRRPQVPAAASDPTDRTAFPEVVELPAPCEVRARVVAVPTTTAPTLAAVGVRFEVA